MPILGAYMHSCTVSVSVVIATHTASFLFLCVPSASAPILLADAVNNTLAGRNLTMVHNPFVGRLQIVAGPSGLDMGQDFFSATNSTNEKLFVCCSKGAGTKPSVCAGTCLLQQVHSLCS